MRDDILNDRGRATNQIAIFDLESSCLICIADGMHGAESALVADGASIDASKGTADRQRQGKRARSSDPRIVIARLLLCGAATGTPVEQLLGIAPH
ncbi:hypothetical protein N2601_31090 (plasmid) [Rhizobium sp. CB3060]|uniref:hypothetical protein n=1 Tax=Rhizobium sp. CB3060 TaxID=3138255 RepID=UPI0021A64837|nr:hypothetical protein [Rhizobium tropici]UWU25436.1 hypothetical protein N2601_31090 [Rhizobium tropici]